MARISSYQLDQVITGDDFVIGSDALTKKTKNYRLSDLAVYFAQNINIDGVLYDVANISTKVDNINTLFTYDAPLGNPTGFSTEFIEFLNTILVEGTGITINYDEEAGDITITTTPDKHDSLSFTTATFGSPANEETFDGVTYKYIDFVHNLEKFPAVTVTETSNPDRICYVPIKYIDNNTVRVYFRGVTSGTVYVN
jgi:hypothetical protein